MFSRTPGSVSSETSKRRRVKLIHAPSAAPPKRRDSLPIGRLTANVDGWLLDLQAASASNRYLDSARDILTKFVWWMDRDGIERFDADAIRGFLMYLRTAHETAEGRWGEPGQTRADHSGKRGYPISARYKELSDRSLLHYYGLIRTFCNWLKKQHILDDSPTELVREPITRPGLNFYVFSKEELRRIEEAARRGPYPARDRALVLFLLDTGIRATELCSLAWCDMDMTQRRAQIVGKGDKRRTIYWHGDTSRALWAYRLAVGVEEDTEAPVFYALGGPTAGYALTRGGLRKILGRIGRDAEAPHCHPHTFRHTFATLFLLGGGSQITLMHLMGHEDLEMTQRYVRFTGADMAGQAAAFSPVSMMKRGRKG
jgi:integrase/recombinase XerC